MPAVPQRVRDLAANLALAALYFLSANFGLSLGVEEQVTAVWPPSGLALAAVVLFGRRMWPGVWLGAVCANVVAGAGLATAAGIAVGNTTEAALGAWLLGRAGFDRSLERLRDVVALLLAAAAATVPAALVGVTSLCLAGIQPWARFPGLAGVWWLGDAMGILLVGAFLLAWSVRPSWRAARVLEFALVIAGLAWAVQAVFEDPQYVLPNPLTYVAYPFVIWTAFRFGQPGTTLAILTASAVSTWATVNGLGPFGAASVDERWIPLQTFTGMLAITGTMLGAAICERDRAERHRSAEYAVARHLARESELAAAARRIVEGVCEALDFDLGALWTVDEDASALRCVELWHRPELAAPGFVAESRRVVLEHGADLPGRVWSSAAPCWIEDVVGDPGFARAPLAAHEGLHGAFGFPIVLEGEVLGVLEFFSRRVRRPDDELLRLLASVGNHIGHFIERTRLLERERRARGEAEALAEDLREEHKAKDHFLAVLGHELRNPLAPVLNALQVLRAGPSDAAEARDLLAMMERQVRHMARLVDDLLDVSRIARGTIEIRREQVDLGRVVRRVAEANRALLADHRFAVRVPPAPVVVTGDETRLHQIVSNLVNNAARYTPAGGDIAVALDVEDGAAVVRVRDSGIGIRREHLQRIFEAFTQADRVPGRVHEGLGIGLTLAQQLAERHGGTIRAQSRGPDTGSEFEVRLPLAAAAAAAAPVHSLPALPALPPPATARPARRVLVVDDNRDSADTLALLLRARGHDTEVAYDGAEALARFAARRPDVVLLDIELPHGLGGHEVARRMRALAGAEPLKLVALTGYGREEDRRRSSAAGFDLHLVKPVDPRALEGVVAP